MKYPRKIRTFERGDRDSLPSAIEGMETVILFAESMKLIEEFGLSLNAIEKDGSIAWVCTDPDGLFSVEAWTPSGAVSSWNFEREKVYGQNDAPVLRVVKDD